ncbi:MAG: type I-E CRISPR-associated protein Cas5/CasD [Thermodesulfobacteriota bacterium]
MKNFLILRLEGPMQAWGGHTFEDYRPSEIFPTRSGVVGLLGACLGLDRDDFEGREALSASFIMAVRSDASRFGIQKITDFHTIMDARRVDGKAGKFPIISRREYLCNAVFTLALEFCDGARFSLEDVATAIQRPRYTPFLGRRSCPLGRPLYEGVVQAKGLLNALSKTAPFAGTIYDEGVKGPNRIVVRDVPMPGPSRKFTTREVYIHQQEVKDVSE